MISNEMQKALNSQINKELYSAYYYLSMAAFLESENFDGMANFMKIQAREEIGHAMKIFSYVNEQGGQVLLEAIDKPKTEFSGPQEVFKLSREHERFVTESIYSLVDLSLKENDYATKAFLDWFVTEQVEEENTMEGIVNKLKIIGDAGHGLLMLDAQLGQRAPETEESEE